MSGSAVGATTYKVIGKVEDLYYNPFLHEPAKDRIDFPEYRGLFAFDTFFPRLLSKLMCDENN